MEWKRRLDSRELKLKPVDKEIHFRISYRCSFYSKMPKARRLKTLIAKSRVSAQQATD